MYMLAAKPDNIAHASTSDGNHMSVALQAFVQKPPTNLLDKGKAFGGFSARQHKHVVAGDVVQLGKAFVGDNQSVGVTI